MIKNNPRKQIEFRAMVAAIVKAMAKGEYTSHEVIARCEQMETWVDNYVQEEVEKWIHANSTMKIVKD